MSVFYITLGCILIVFLVIERPIPIIPFSGKHPPKLFYHQILFNVISFEKLNLSLQLLQLCFDFPIAILIGLGLDHMLAQRNDDMV